jgi:calcineurin-like phosphoesterase family protein
MSRIFFHSDWHFNHSFVAGTRGFDTAEEHDDALIDAINTACTKRDHIWFLGDTFMGSITKGLEQVARIHAVKHLVLGNHDAAHPLHKGSHNKLRRFLEQFESVHLHEKVGLKTGSVLVSHLPFQGDHYDGDRFEEWRLRDHGRPLVCGHVHHQWATSGRQFNAGVDHHFSPVPASEIEEWVHTLTQSE